MSDIERRIERAERAVGIEEENRPVNIVRVEYGSDDTFPRFPEPVEQWVTLQRAIDESQRRRVPCVFITDPFTEYELHHGLQPGTLAKHELRGKVPFAEQLAAATRRTPDQGEQPCID